MISAIRYPQVSLSQNSTSMLLLEDKMQQSLWSLISLVPVSQHSSINTFANLSGLLSKMKTLADFWSLLEKMFQRKKLILYTCKFLTS